MHAPMQRGGDAGLGCCRIDGGPSSTVGGGTIGAVAAERTLAPPTEIGGGACVVGATATGGVPAIDTRGATCGAATGCGGCHRREGESSAGGEPNRSASSAASREEPQEEAEEEAEEEAGALEEERATLFPDIPVTPCPSRSDGASAQLLDELSGVSEAAVLVLHEGVTHDTAAAFAAAGAGALWRRRSASITFIVRPLSCIPLHCVAATSALARSLNVTKAHPRELPSASRKILMSATSPCTSNAARSDVPSANLEHTT